MRQLAPTLLLLAGSACSPPPPSVAPAMVKELEIRVSTLEARLTQLTSELEAARNLAQDHAVSSAAAQISAVDFVEMTARLSRKEGIATSDASTIAGLVRAIQHVEWPPEIRQEAEQTIHVLIAFRDALKTRDEDRAAVLSGKAKAYQRTLTREVDRWLTAVSPWSPQVQSAAPGSASHGNDAAHHAPGAIPPPSKD